MLRLFAVLVFAGVLPAGVAAAQSDSLPPPEPWHFGWGGGLHFGGPVKASFALGGGLKKGSSAPEDHSHFLFLFAEPGLGGHRASLGYAESVGSLGGGWSIRSSVLRIMRNGTHRNYAGLELQVIPLLCLGSRVGAFRPLDGQPGRDRLLWIADVSLCL